MSKMMYGTCSRGCCGRGVNGRAMRPKEDRDWRREAWEQNEIPRFGVSSIYEGLSAFRSVP